jgi:hypothetical protein
MVGWYIKDERERIWKEAVGVLPNVPLLRFEPSTSQIQIPIITAISAYSVVLFLKKLIVVELMKEYPEIL